MAGCTEDEIAGIYADEDDAIGTAMRILGKYPVGRQEAMFAEILVKVMVQPQVEGLTARELAEAAVEAVPNARRGARASASPGRSGRPGHQRGDGTEKLDRRIRLGCIRLGHDRQAARHRRNDPQALPPPRGQGSKAMKAKVGDRIELISMRDDPDPIEPGTRGTVDFVNDNPALGFVQYGVQWDNGRHADGVRPSGRVQGSGSGQLG